MITIPKSRNRGTREPGETTGDQRGRVLSPESGVSRQGKLNEHQHVRTTEVGAPKIYV